MKVSIQRKRKKTSAADTRQAHARNMLLPPSYGLPFIDNTVAQRKTDNSSHSKTVRDDKEVIQRVKNPAIISNRNKKYALLSTTHGISGKDLSEKVPGDITHDTAIVLEYPSLAGTGKSVFGEDAIKNVNDKTQASLARFGAAHKDSNNIELVGADGRKAFENDHVHSVSIRHKDQSAFNVQTAAVIPKSLLLSLSDKYADRCLNIIQGPVDFIVNRLNTILHYHDGTNLSYVMTNTWQRTSSLSAKLPLDRRKSIKRKVIGKINKDMDAAIDYYRSNKKQYTAYGYLQDLIDETNSSLIGALHDSFANLLLYTEVLASDKKNVIVAYGGDHLEPLQQLVGETWATKKKRKNKK